MWVPCVCSTMWEEVRHDLIEHFFESLIAAAGKPLKNMFKNSHFFCKKDKERLIRSIFSNGILNSSSGNIHARTHTNEGNAPQSSNYFESISSPSFPPENTIPFIFLFCLRSYITFSSKPPLEVTPLLVE